MSERRPRGAGPLGRSGAPRKGDTARPRPAEDDGDFLGRWSRRKAEARRADAESSGSSGAERGSPAKTGSSSAERGSPASAGPSRSESDSRTRAGKTPAVAPAPGIPDLPDIESLTAASDFRVFMAKGVPDDIRNQALRKLWRLKPSLANLDGLVDYGHDYTRAATVVAGLKTAYQVGKGYLERIEAPDERRLAAGPDAAEPAPATVAAETGDTGPGDAPAAEDPEHAEDDQPEAPVTRPERSG